MKRGGPCSSERRSRLSQSTVPSGNSVTAASSSPPGSRYHSGRSSSRLKFIGEDLSQLAFGGSECCVGRSQPCDDRAQLALQHLRDAHVVGSDRPRPGCGKHAFERGEKRLRRPNLGVAVERNPCGLKTVGESQPFLRPLRSKKAHQFPSRHGVSRVAVNGELPAAERCGRCAAFEMRQQGHPDLCYFFPCQTKPAMPGSRAIPACAVRTSSPQVRGTGKPYFSSRSLR